MNKNEENNELLTTRKDIFTAYVDDEDVKTIDVYKPFSSAVCLIDNTKVARTSKTENIDLLMKNLKVGDRLKLIREPNNLNNKNAVKVETQNNEKLGYVSCDCDELISKLLDGGKDVFANITSLEKVGPWNKIDIEVMIDD